MPPGATSCGRKRGNHWPSGGALLMASVMVTRFERTRRMDYLPGLLLLLWAIRLILISGSMGLGLTKGLLMQLLKRVSDTGA